MKIGWPYDRRQTLLLVAVALALIALILLYLLGTALIALGISFIIAYMLMGPVRLIERAMPWRKARPALNRTVSIFIVYVLAIAIVAGILAAIIPSIVEDSRRFASEIPTLFESIRATAEDWVGRYTDDVPASVKDRIQQYIDDASGLLGDVAWSFVSRTVEAATSSFALILSLAAAPVIVYGLLKDSSRIRASLYTPFPPDLQPHLRNLLDIAERTLGGYVRGQLILAAIVGVMVTVGLVLLDVPFAFVLGLVAGLTELVPTLGPFIGGLFGVLVTLAVAPDKVLWVFLLYLGVQVFENTLLAGRIQSNALRIHPVWLIIVIVIAGKYFGIWGIIIGPPIVAVARDIAVWLSQEWNRSEAPEEGVKAEEPE